MSYPSDDVFEEARSRRAPPRRSQFAAPRPAEWLPAAIEVARLSLQFGRVNRATLDEDGAAFETDTTHTVMLGLLAMITPPPALLDPGLIAEFVFVHDLVEAVCGDTNTATGLTPEQAAVKEQLEADAFEHIRTVLPEGCRLVRLMERYEEQEEPEARWVRYLDKLAPKLTHLLNGGAAWRLNGGDHDSLVAAHRAQAAKLAARYPEFQTMAGLFDLVAKASEDAFDPDGPIPTIPPPDGATEALDDIAKLSGIESWEYPGQVVRDVLYLVRDVLRACDGGEALLRERLRAAGLSESMARVVFGEGPAADSAIGDDRAPTRYTGQGRETIDRIRDQLGDDGFIAFCRGNEQKYRDRAGRKGDASEDLGKADWYAQMARHVEQPDVVEDPRAGRPDFAPYQRQDGGS